MEDRESWNLENETKGYAYFFRLEERVGWDEDRERERMGNGRIFIEVEDRCEDSGMVANFVMYY